MSGSGKKDTVRCALIGIGAQGKKYAALLNGHEIDGMALTAVCCRSGENAAWVREHLAPSVKVFRDEDELYENSDAFDAVLIATPHRQHPAMTIRALNHGKHVLCDKPAGITASDATAMAEAARESGKKYGLICNQRAYEQMRRIRSLLSEQAIGKLLRVTQISSRNFRTQHYHRSSEWRSSWHGEGGGALINQGYHLMDLWQFLFGMPETLYADIPFGKYNRFLVDDECTLVMRYADGLSGTFILTTGEGTTTERLEIVGTRGRILLEDNQIRLTLLNRDSAGYASEAVTNAREGLHATEHLESFGPQDRAYHAVLQNFADAVLQDTQLIAPGDDGVNTLRLINGAYLSAWQGKIIAMPPPDAVYQKMLQEKEKAEESE